MSENTPTFKSYTLVVVLTIVLATTCTVLAALRWVSHRCRQAGRATTEHRSQITHLRGAIVHLDEVLTMSARMAALTGDLEWEDRYRRFQPQLETALREAMALAPEIGCGETATYTNVANIQLMEMENRAFHLVRQGRAAEAATLLLGEAYASRKRIYAEGTDTLARRLAAAALADLRREAHLSTLENGAFLLVVAVWITGWVVVWRRSFGP
jgi:hypothetical protein